MSTLTRRDRSGPFVDLFDWLESPLTMLRPLAAQPMLVEDGRNAVRAELPGLNPGRELEVTMSHEQT